MEEIRDRLKAVSQRYNKGLPHFDACIALIAAAHGKLTTHARFEPYGRFAGKPPVPYHVFAISGAVSRPVRPDLYIVDVDNFLSYLAGATKALSRGGKDLDDKEVFVLNAVVYTSIMSVACCYDLWQRGSRKTPGTFFEFFMAALLQGMLPGAVFSKHIPLAALLEDTEIAEGVSDRLDASDEDEEEGGAASVSTDLVIGSRGKAGGVVIPLKITTRERIVQPFAHQRILDSAFGKGVFQSLLVCISETQLDDKTKSVKQVCVPGTVKLFQRHLASVAGLYYCDIPQRYFAKDMQRIIPVKSVGDFFKDVALVLDSHGQS